MFNSPAYFFISNFSINSFQFSFETNFPWNWNCISERFYKIWAGFLMKRKFLKFVKFLFIWGQNFKFFQFKFFASSKLLFCFKFNGIGSTKFNFCCRSGFNFSSAMIDLVFDDLCLCFRLDFLCGWSSGMGRGFWM